MVKKIEYYKYLIRWKDFGMNGEAGLRMRFVSGKSAKGYFLIGTEYHYAFTPEDNTTFWSICSGFSIDIYKEKDNDKN